MAGFFADRRDAKVLRGLVARFDKLRRADWDEVDRLAEVLHLADSLNASQAVRVALRNHPPVREAIEANQASPFVRAFLSRG